MIKPKNFICVICHKKFDGYGNNAQPVREGQCCDWCNDEVILERLRLMELQQRGEE
jgi:hypothetical protein